jgi:hypothetical protein
LFDWYSEYLYLTKNGSIEYHRCESNGDFAGDHSDVAVESVVVVVETSDSRAMDDDQRGVAVVAVVLDRAGVMVVESVVVVAMVVAVDEDDDDDDGWDEDGVPCDEVRRVE